MKTSSCAARLREKMEEKAQHTSVCEHFDEIFSIKACPALVAGLTADGRC